MNIKKRYFLSKKDIKKINEELKNFFEEDIIPKKGNVEIAITDEYEIILVDKEPVAFKKDDKVIPTIRKPYWDTPSINGDFQSPITSNKKRVADYGFIPTLKLLLKYPPKKNIVVVDMGAIKFLINGADVMAPGIVDADENINEDDIVFVVDETHNKPICVGIALMNGKEMKEADKGKAIKNIHYVGDKIWNFKG